MTTVNIFGPGHYPSTNEVAVRPVQTATGKGFDTWFGQCAADGSGGTAIDEMFLNFLLGSLRQAVRTAGAAENELSEVMLAEASARYASGGIAYQDAGVKNAYVLNPTGNFIAPKSLFAMMVAFWIPAVSNDGPSTINIGAVGSLLGIKPIVTPDGAALVGGELLAATPSQLFYSPTIIGGGAWILPPWANALNFPKYLAANRNYYVNAVTGNDNNSGLTPSAPWATISHAMEVVSRLNLFGYSVTINVANGTYSPWQMRRSLYGSSGDGYGSVSVLGNVSSPQSCIISSPDARDAIGCALDVGAYIVRGFRVQSSGGAGLRALGKSSEIQVGAMEFGACADSHMVAQGGIIGFLGPNNGFASDFIRISGGAAAHLRAFQGGIINGVSGLTPLSISAPVSFASAFAVAQQCSYVEPVYASITNPGNVTGSRYQSMQCSMIETGSGNVNYLPGTTAGSTPFGGQYH